MQEKLRLEQIEKAIEGLTPQEQLKLVEKIIHNLRNKTMTKAKQLDWDLLYGLGKGLWKDEDAQDYVNKLREDRI
ncbi:MAG: hypothetical protein ACFFC7_26435 [Candidatus Hermodarchaeota archaeon]